MKNIAYIAASLLLAASLAAPALAQTYPSYAVYPGQSYCPPLTYNLYRGLHDYQTAGQVSQLQYFLGTYFASEPVPVSGYYGPITTNFVARFQQAQGVYPITGGVGPLTRAAIARQCGQGGYPNPVPGYGVPVINSLQPAQGPVGTVVSVQGSGFTQNNVVHFGVGGRIQVQSFNNGTLIYFTIPQSTSNCDIIQTFAVCASPVMQVAPGTYPLYITNENGQSGTYTFSVTGSGGGTICSYSYPYICPPQSSVSVLSPSSGQTYARGGQMPITWSGSLSQNASTILDLYSVSTGKVGTIAIQNGVSGNYTWGLPPFPNNLACTLQYPNGLCGANIPDGQYYVKATVVAGNGFDNGSQLATADSGTFSITGSGTGTLGTVSAYPQSGPAPLTVVFSVNNYSGLYAVDFGDGASASLQSGQISHTYNARGTYTATFQSDLSCMHTTPRCLIATQLLGNITITAY